MVQSTCQRVLNQLLFGGEESRHDQPPRVLYLRTWISHRALEGNATSCGIIRHWIQVGILASSIRNDPVKVHKMIGGAGVSRVQEGAGS